MSGVRDSQPVLGGQAAARDILKVDDPNQNGEKMAAAGRMCAAPPMQMRIRPSLANQSGIRSEVLLSSKSPGARGRRRARARHDGRGRSGIERECKGHAVRSGSIRRGDHDGERAALRKLRVIDVGLLEIGQLILVVSVMSVSEMWRRLVPSAIRMALALIERARHLRS